MNKIALVVAALVFAATAQASPRATMRVDRPQKGAVTHVRLIHGAIGHRTSGVVLTDTRCNPDRHGVSHCLNVIRLTNGKTILVVHDHMMMLVPCLSPGEHVVVRPT